MKLLVKVLFLFIVGLSVSNSQHVSLVGSHTLPTGSDYRVYLSAQDLTEDSVINLKLQDDAKVFEHITGGLSQEVNFKLPQNHLSSYRLNIVYQNKATNACMRQSVIVRDAQNQQQIIIHHDKPVYKNGDTIKFRTIVLDRDMLPYKYTRMNISILDGRKNVIKTFENVKSSKFGVYEDYVKVAESPNLGVWRIEVNVDGKTRSKHFPVKHHEKRSFEVLVQSMDSEVPFDDEYVFLHIQAKSPVNKLFNGVAKISSSARLDGKDEPMINKFVKNVTLPLDKSIVSLRISDDLGIRSPMADMVATLTVEVYEHRTRHYEMASVDVPLRMYRNRLQLVRNPSFKPGFDFDMTIKAKTLNGDPDMSLRQLTMTVDYEEFNEETHTSSTRKEVFNLNLKNGELDVVLHPSDITRSIKVIFEFGGTELTERIPKIDNNGINEYMQATIDDKKVQYDPTETLKLTARSSGQLQTLHVLVIGSSGLVYSKNYPEAHGKSSFKFDLKLSTQMSPEAYIFVFYARAEDGVMISDEQLISLTYTRPNSLEITPEIQATKPRGTVALHLKTVKDSLVFLGSVDQNVTLLGHGSQLSQSYLYESANNGLGRLNTFVLQPLVSGVPCNSNDMVERLEDDEEATFEEQSTQKYFPNVWFHETIEIKTDNVQSIQKQVPNNLTSWIVYGASMHPTKGYVAAKKEAKVSVFNEMTLMVNTPASVHDGEVLNLEVGVYNLLKSSQSVQITVAIENGDTMDEKTSSIGGKVCKTYTRRRNPTATFTQQVSANSLSASQNLFVQPLALGVMKVKVTATGPNGAADEIVRVIEVRERRQLRETEVAGYLIDLANDKTLDRNVVMNLPLNAELVNVYALFSGNLLGPVVDNLELFSDVPMDYREPRSSNFMLSMIIAEYHQSRHNEISVEINDAMLKGYQETLHSLQHDDSQTSLQKSALFYVYATFALIKAKSFLAVDDTNIEMALDNLKTKQDTDGSFMDGPDIDMGQGSSQRHILTAQFTLAFIKYQTYSNKYDDVITKAMRFLDSTKTQLTTDYEKVLVAYTFSAHGDQESSKFLTSTLICTFANNPNFDDETSLYVGIASFLIELKIAQKEDPRIEVEWLLRQRRPDGSFFSPHDTLSALHALLTYALDRNTDRVNLRVLIDEQSGVVNNNNNQLLRLKLSQKDHYALNVAGTGLGYATIYYEYIERTITNQTNRNFGIRVEKTALASDMLEIKVDAKLLTPGMQRTNLVIVEVEMPSGYEFYNHVDGDHIKKVEHWNDRTKAVFYIDFMEANQVYTEVIRAVRVYQVEYTVTSVVRVYDYYRPNIRDELQYDYDLNMMNCRPRESQQQDDKQETTPEKNRWTDWIG